MNKMGICPVCNGTGRTKVSPLVNEASKKYIWSYDPADDTEVCHNCGGQYTSGKATGKVRLRPDGTPCAHEYEYKRLGNCWHGYTCKHCKDFYEIDSSG